MNFPRCFPFRPAVLLGLAAALLVGGCKDMLVAKRKVIVDAISAPGAAKPAGQSYRLVAKRAVVSGTQVRLPFVKACLDAALVHEGLFEAPPNVPSDIFIEVNYGLDTTSRIDPLNREGFLELSARANHQRTLDPSGGEEVWNVRTAIAGLAGPLESAMPLLATVAVSYAGTDTHAEAAVLVPDNAPAVLNVRETAIKSLSAKTDAIKK